MLEKVLMQCHLLAMKDNFIWTVLRMRTTNPKSCVIYSRYDTIKKSRRCREHRPKFCSSPLLAINDSKIFSSRTFNNRQTNKRCFLQLWWIPWCRLQRFCSVCQGMQCYRRKIIWRSIIYFVAGFSGIVLYVLCFCITFIMNIDKCHYH